MGGTSEEGVRRGASYCTTGCQQRDGAGSSAPGGRWWAETGYRGQASQDEQAGWHSCKGGKGDSCGGKGRGKGKTKTVVIGHRRPEAQGGDRRPQDECLQVVCTIRPKEIMQRITLAFRRQAGFPDEGDVVLLFRERCLAKGVIFSYRLRNKCEYASAYCLDPAADRQVLHEVMAEWFVLLESVGEDLDNLSLPSCYGDAVRVPWFERIVKGSLPFRQAGSTSAAAAADVQPADRGPAPYTAAAEAGAEQPVGQPDHPLQQPDFPRLAVPIPRHLAAKAPGPTERLLAGQTKLWRQKFHLKISTGRDNMPKELIENYTLAMDVQIVQDTLDAALAAGASCITGGSGPSSYGRGAGSDGGGRTS